MTSDPSLAHLLGRLAVVEARVRSAVTRRRAGDPAPDDPFRGLYLSDDHVDRLLAPPGAPEAPDPGSQAMLAEVEAAADEAEAAGADVRLRRLAQTFGLAPLDVELLLVALAPDLESRFERLYGYLNDDVTRRRASVGLALELCGVPLGSARGRGRLTTGGPLVDAGLVLIEDPDRPLPSRALRVPDRVTAHLLGDDQPDPLVAALGVPVLGSPVGDPAGLARAIRDGAGVCALKDRPAASARALASAAFGLLGWPAINLDLQRLEVGDDIDLIARAAAREARLRGAGLVAGPLETLVERGPAAVRAFAELPCSVVLIGRVDWDPNWSRRVVPLLAEAPAAGLLDRSLAWEASLNGSADGAFEPGKVTAQFHLGPEEIVRAATSARLRASLAGTELAPDDVRAGARSQNAAGLQRLARRIEPSVNWDDLVLPPTALTGLKEIAARARNRDLVLDEWGMRPGGGRGRGITVLFAGDSGTGKTMSAEVLAGELGLDLYTINLATVVDKYVGETEKNLERIFTEADGVNGVLLFDEADALFGKRSEVKDAHDRYANIEVAYLLQRMESFDGLAILSTNLRANIDEAFARRLDSIVDFPMPEEEYRRVLWDRCLSRGVPRADDIDLDFCARAFEFSGGNIRSIAIAAAYRAAETGRPVNMEDLIRTTQQEYRKLGRLCVESEFGPYFRLVTTQ